MDISSFVVSQLALFSWREGERIAPGSDDAKTAIAWIVASRVRAGWRDGNWMQVLEHMADHSASEPGEMMSFVMPDPWHPTWRRLSETCSGIYSGTIKDTVTMTPDRAALAANLPGAERNPANQSRPSFFYANLNMPIREWFMTKIIRQPAEHPRTVEIFPIVLYG